jgi:beta-lactamase regulating signal transducer with metallopeptidase domain
MAEWLILHTLSVAALAALAATVCRFARPRPAARHALWLLVLVKLLTPPVVYWPIAFPLPGILTRAHPAEHRQRAGTDDPADAPAPLAGPWLIVDAPEEEFVPVRGPHYHGPEALDPSRTAAAAWAIGGVVAAVVQGWRVWRFGHRIARGREAPSWLTATVCELAAELGIRPPRVTVMEDIDTPMVWGFGRPRLLWPAGLEARLTPDGVRAVLAHELAHLRRQDHRVSWLLLAGGCAWWWHPLYYLARRRLGCEAEAACDALVTGFLPSARRAYAEALLAVAAKSSRTVVPALGAASGRRDLERRLTMIMRERVPGRLSARWLAVLLAITLVWLPTWSRGQDSAKQPANPARVGPPVAPEDTSPRKPVDPRVPTREKELSPQEREKRLEELEGRMRSVLKELHELRGMSALPASPTDAPIGPTWQQLPPQSPYYQPITTFQPDGSPVTQYRLVRPIAADATSVSVLSRTSYRLPPGKAEALAAFLKEHVKASVLETRIDGDELVVTTEPGGQHAIAGIVALIRGKPQAATYPAAVPARPAAPPAGSPSP